jgi:hypothetical protein
MGLGTTFGDVVRPSGSAVMKGAARGRTPFDATLKSHDSLLLTNAWNTATELLRYHLPVADVANLTGLPANSVAGMRRALAQVDGRHTVMGRAGRPPHSFITMVNSPDTHIVMSGFSVAFMSAYRLRGEKTINGEDILKGMNFCRSHGANLNDECTTRRMLLVAQCLVSGEAEITVCRCCRTQFVRSKEPQFVAGRPEQTRGECPFCAKARTHYGDQGAASGKPIEEF